MTIVELLPLITADLVRVGRDFDGGYLVPQRALRETSVLVCMGIDIDWSFEDDFLRSRPEARLIAIDGSTGVSRIVRRALRSFYWGIYELPRNPSALFRRSLEMVRLFRKALQFQLFFSGRNRRFIKKMIAANQGEGRTTWEELLSQEGVTEEDQIFAKIDIEGAEYEIIEAVLTSAHQIVALVIEFHDLDERFGEFKTACEKLQSRFVLVHTHCNNYTPWIDPLGCTRVVEVTWLHRSLLNGTEVSAEGDYYDVALDRPCNPAVIDRHLHFG